MAITTTKKGSLVGCAYIQAWLVGSDGLMYGTAGESAANGTTTHARLLRNPVSAQVPNPQRIVTALKGGNKWLGQVQFGIDTIGNFPMVLEDTDADFFAMATDGTADITENSRWTQIQDGKNNENLPQLGLCFSTLFQSRDDASDGVNLWINYIVPRCQVDVNFAQMAYQAEGQVTCQVSPTMSRKKPNGLALTGMKAKGGRTVMYAVITPKPLAFTMAIGAGTPVTTFTLGYKPASVVLTSGSNTSVQYTLDSVITPLASGVQSTGVMTKSDAGDTDDKNIAIYETEFEEIAA